MARDRKQVITLGLNFEIENQSLDKVSKKMQEIATVKLSTNKSNNILQGMVGNVNEYMKLIKSLGKELNKPMFSKSQAKSIGSAMSEANASIGKRLGIARSSLEKSYNSPKNSQNILDIKNLGNQISSLQTFINKIKDLL